MYSLRPIPIDAHATRAAQRNGFFTWNISRCRRTYATLRNAMKRNVRNATVVQYHAYVIRKGNAMDEFYTPGPKITSKINCTNLDESPPQAKKMLTLGPRDHSSSVRESLALGLETFSKVSITSLIQKKMTSYEMI